MVDLVNFQGASTVPNLAPSLNQLLGVLAKQEERDIIEKKRFDIGSQLDDLFQPGADINPADQSNGRDCGD